VNFARSIWVAVCLANCVAFPLLPASPAQTIPTLPRRLLRAPSLSKLENSANDETCPMSVAGWGNNGEGETTTPTNLTGVAAIAAGGYHSLVLKSDGTVVGWGADWSGQATPPDGLSNAVAIAAGYDFSLALKTDGTVVGWGASSAGQTAPPADLSNAVAIAAGFYHSLALKTDGTVLGWGYDGYGQATPPADLTNIVAIAARGYHSLALKSDGTVVGWGYDGYGEATPPADLTDAVAITAGDYHSIALKSDGTVVGWGYDGYGEATPRADLTNVVAVAAGAYHSLVLKSDGTVVAWGYDYYGLSSGADGMSGVTVIAAGSYHSLALTTAPNPPSDPTATTVATNQVDLSWIDNSSNEDGFEIERAPDDGGSPGTWTQIGTAAANVTGYSDTGVAPDEAYGYRVRAKSAACGDSLANRIVVSLTPPAAPYWLSGTVVATNQIEVVLSWYAASSDAAGYKIERAPNEDGDPGAWTEIGTVIGGTNTLYADTDIWANATYWYRVRAYNLFGDSDSSYPTVVTVGPPGPPYLYAVTLVATQIEVKLQWSGNGISSGYKVERAPEVSGSPGTWTEIANIVGNNSTSYGDSDVLPNATYWYRVRVYNLIGDSNYSNEAYMNVAPPCCAPYYITAYVPGTNLEVDVYWFDSNNSYANVAGYKLERALDVSGSPGTWTEIAATTNGFSYYNSYQDTDVIGNVTYWYRARAYNVIGDSPSSYEISVGLLPPAAPYYLSGSVNSVGVHLYWYESDYSNVAGYKLERAIDVGGSPGTWTQIADVFGMYNNEFDDYDVTANATYWYRVQAYNAVGDSPASYAVSVSVFPPATPYSLTANLYSADYVYLSWYETDYSNVAGYKLERANDVGGSPGAWTEIANNVGAYFNYYYDYGVTANASYWYRVRAYNGIGDSAYADPVKVDLKPPVAPTSLTATSNCPGQISLSWAAPAGTVSGFKLERAPDSAGNPGAWTQIADVGSFQTIYTDTGLVPGMTYWYRVRAYNLFGDSTYSDAISAVSATTAVDYFTELLGGNNSILQNRMYTFTPDASASFYRACRETINALPTDPAGGTTLSEGDDTYAQVTPSGGAQVALYGTHYSTFFVGSNGYITFGSGDTTYSVSLFAHFNRPRISPLFDDLNPSTGGTVSWKQLSDRVVVTYLNVTHYSNTGANTFQVEMFFNGQIRIAYLHLDAAFGLVGLSRGTDISCGGNSDFSIYGPCATAAFVVTPTNAFGSIGDAGGPFTPGTQTYTLGNTNAAPLDWSVTKTAAWIDLSTTNGTLAGGSDTSITVALNANANALLPGTYSDMLQFNDPASGAFIARAVNLSVRFPPGQSVRVMQWNVERNLGRQSNNNSSAAQAIARLINYNQPDVLLFNEIDTQYLFPTENQAALIDWVTNNVPYLGSQPGVTFYVAVSLQSDGFIRNGVISRFPIVNPITYNDGLRGLHSFQVQLSGETVLQVYHAHLKCCNDGDSCPRKQSEAQLDANIISAWAATNTSPYIFAGDWNEDEQSPLCALPNAVATIREGARLVEFRPTTLDGEYRTWGTYYWSNPSIRFDYIYAATNRLAPVSGFVFDSRVWSNRGLYDGYYDNYYASDHYCVFADYFFPASNFGFTPTDGFASTGILSGPFTPASRMYTLTNTNTVPLSWSAGRAASWLSISPSNGILAAGASITIAASINSAANSLPIGRYTDAITLSNAATHAFLMRGVKLSVLDPSTFQGWQSRYFGCTDCAEAAADGDTDGDGQSNMAEFLAGTDPTNSDSAFRIVSILVQGANTVITWKTAGGRTNILQAGPGDFDNNSSSYSNQFWDMSAPIIIPGHGNAITNFTDDGSWWGDFSNWPARYYRVRVVP
jgi:hypothetical protein